MLKSFMNRTDIKLMTTAYLTYLCTRHTYINTAHTYIYTALHMYAFTVQPQLIPAVNCSLACMYCGDLAALCKMQVSTKAQEMDGRFGAVHRSVQLLEKYGRPISKDVSAFLAVAPQKWVSLKKKIGIAKQRARVSPKVQANAELVNQVCNAVCGLLLAHTNWNGLM